MIVPAPGLTIEQQPEDVLRRLVLWGEARGESALGMLAVLWVIANRAAKKGTSAKAVILAPLQFSSLNSDDPNRGKLLKAWVTDVRGWAVVDAVCELYEKASTTDPTKGADHYYVTAMLAPPAWGRGSDDWHETAEIGKHCFGTCP